MSVTLSFIAAMDENRLMGTQHGIPWHLPRDIAHFRSYTQGKWLLIGRRTYDEMKGWFSDHTPLILTSQCGYDPPVGRAVASVPQAIALAEAAGQSELACIGGAAVFAAALPYASRMVLTFVHHRIEASRGVYFPKWEPSEWQETSRQHFSDDAEHAFSMDIVTLSRRAAK